jgi:TolB-like protein/Tfp pilus assembly protein PilF
MKRCPQCGRDYNDPTLSFCLDDGAALLDGPANSEEQATAILPGGEFPSEAPTRAHTRATEDTAVLPSQTSGKLGKAESKWLLVLTPIAVILVVAIAYSGYVYFGDNAASIDSIAILPFENPENDADTEYLSEGVAESIIYELTKIPELKVSPRSSSFRYKGTKIDAEKVGKELGVDAVLSGRIVQRGDDLSLSVELIDVRTKRAIWGERYQRSISDILRTRNEITSAITKNLRARLSGDENPAASTGFTENNEAYRNYLRGKFYTNKRTAEGLRNAIKSFEASIETDPGFALAYVGLAMAYAHTAGYNYIPVSEARTPARAAVNKALTLDPDMAEAHVANGYLLALHDWDWKRSEAAFKRALELDPELSEAHYFYGGFSLRIFHRYKEAIVEVRKALELEPMSVPIGANLARLYYYNGEYDKALEQGARVYELEKGHPTTLFWYGRILNYAGKYAEAKQICSIDGESESDSCRSIIGYALAKEGNTKEAREILALMEADEANVSARGTRTASVYIALGEYESAIDDLETDFEKRESSLWNVISDPIFAPLYDKPRFKELVAKMGLTLPARQ